jgi:hypothetical protein
MSTHGQLMPVMPASADRPKPPNRAAPGPAAVTTRRHQFCDGTVYDDQMWIAL